MNHPRSFLLAGVVAMLGPAAIHASDPPPAPPGPAYRIVLRSRTAEAIPTRTKDAQTGGGSIVVDQPEPNTIIVTMGGSAVAGSDCHGSAAGLTFELEEDLEIIPTRPGVRPPRIGLVGRVIGTLQVTDPGKCGRECGAAEQGPATAWLSSGETGLLTLNVKPSAVACGQELAINYREGPVECRAAAGCYRLNASFQIGVTQGKNVFNRQAAVADFDPAPQLDAFWADILKPFRAVPRGDFGFKLVLRVIEDATPEGGTPK
jgi:hypothetical protein